MDQEILVDPQIEDGKRLIAQLLRDNLDVSVAFWAKTSESGLWYFYIGSKSFGSMTPADAYRRVFASLRQIPDAAIEYSQIQPIDAENPIAKDALAVRNRYPARVAMRYQGKSLGKVSIDEAYIYPSANGAMSRDEVVQTVASLINRTGAWAPSLLTMRDGQRIQALPVGLQSIPPDGVQIVLRDLDSGLNQSVSADDVVSIL